MSTLKLSVLNDKGEERNYFNISHRCQIKICRNLDNNTLVEFDAFKLGFSKNEPKLLVGSEAEILIDFEPGGETIK